MIVKSFLKNPRPCAGLLFYAVQNNKVLKWIRSQAHKRTPNPQRQPSYLSWLINLLFEPFAGQQDAIQKIADEVKEERIHPQIAQMYADQKELKIICANPRNLWIQEIPCTAF